MKKVLIALAVLVLVPLGSVFAYMLLSFRALQPTPEGGQDLVGGARLINDGFANFYLLPAGPAAALVDCGDDAKGAAILAELKRRSLGPDSVKAIFLTHGHPDHTAACHLFKGAEVFAFAGDTGIAAGTEGSHGPITRFVSGPEEKRIKVTKVLTDGEMVAVGERQVVAFAVPGHTAGSAAYLSGGLLLLGDNANLGRDGALRPAMRLFTDDADLNASSLRALAARLQERGDKVEMTAYGHSAPSEGFKALAAFAR